MLKLCKHKIFILFCFIFFLISNFAIAQDPVFESSMGKFGDSFAPNEPAPFAPMESMTPKSTPTPEMLEMFTQKGLNALPPEVQQYLMGADGLTPLPNILAPPTTTTEKTFLSDETSTNARVHQTKPPVAPQMTSLTPISQNQNINQITPEQQKQLQQLQQLQLALPQSGNASVNQNDTVSPDIALQNMIGTPTAEQSKALQEAMQAQVDRRKGAQNKQSPLTPQQIQQLQQLQGAQNLSPEQILMQLQGQNFNPQQNITQSLAQNPELQSQLTPEQLSQLEASIQSQEKKQGQNIAKDPYTFGTIVTGMKPLFNPTMSLDSLPRVSAPQQSQVTQKQNIPQAPIKNTQEVKPVQRETQVPRKEEYAQDILTSQASQLEALENKEWQKPQDLDSLLADLSLNDLKTRAEEGDSEALYKLGMRYLEGRGVEQDNAKGAELLQKSAQLGYGKAIEVLKSSR